MLHSEVLVSPLQKEFEMEHRHWSTFIHAPFKQQLGIWQHCCCGFTDVHPNVKKVKRLKKKGEKSQFACDWLRTIDFCHFAEFSKGHPSCGARSAFGGFWGAAGHSLCPRHCPMGAPPFLGQLGASPACTTSLSPAGKRRMGHKDERVWEKACNQGAESERKEEMRTVESKTTAADQ